LFGFFWGGVVGGVIFLKKENILFFVFCFFTELQIGFLKVLKVGRYKRAYFIEDLAGWYFFFFNVFNYKIRIFSETKSVLVELAR